MTGLRRQVSIATDALGAVLGAPQVLLYPLLTLVLGVGVPLALIGGTAALVPSLATVGVIATFVAFPVIFAFLMVGYCYEINELFEGRRPGVLEGLRVALGRARMVAVAGLVVGTGQFAAGAAGSVIPFGRIVGTASRWGLQVAGTFAFPVVATTEGSLRDGFDEVRDAVKAEWGKSLVATAGTRAVGLAIAGTGFLAGVALAVGSLLGAVSVSVPPLGPFTLPIALPLLGVFVAILVQFTIDGILKTALYRYARDGELPPAISVDADALVDGDADRSDGSRSAGADD